MFHLLTVLHRYLRAVVKNLDAALLEIISSDRTNIITSPGASWDCPGHCAQGFHLTMVHDAELPIEVAPQLVCFCLSQSLQQTQEVSDSLPWARRQRPDSGQLIQPALRQRFSSCLSGIQMGSSPATPQIDHEMSETVTVPSNPFHPNCPRSRMTHANAAHDFALAVARSNDANAAAHDFDLAVARSNDFVFLPEN